MEIESTRIDDAAVRRAVHELLVAAKEHGLGVVFDPEEDGWRVSYVPYDWPAHQEFELLCGPLSSAYDLETAAVAALRPLNEMGERAARYFASQAERDERRNGN